MPAAVADFLGGLLRECDDLADAWRHRRPPGLDRRLTRLTLWAPLARALPAELDGPNGPALPLDPAQYRRLWGEARALAALQPLTADTIVPTIESLYALMASRFDPPAAFKDDGARAAVAEWAARHLSGPPGLPQAAMALVDFVALDPLSWGSETMAALLAIALPLAGGAPLLPVLGPADRGEEGYRHALEAALDGDHAAWIAFYLGTARRAWKRLPDLAEATEQLRQRWLRLFTRADFGTEASDQLAEALLALPVITPSFVADTGIDTQVLRDGLVLLFAADDAVEMALPDHGGVTLLPGALRLLAHPVGAV